jgi:predicted nucleotidyltransferase
VRDPFERRAADGTIRTGARRDHIATIYEPVLAAAVDLIRAAEPSTSVAVYGSVATGQALPRRSDVDLVAVGLPKPAARAISDDLTTRFIDLCREVAVGAYPRVHLSEVTEAAYGDRVFLRHYCVHLAGTDHSREWPPFLADERAARGFNGDIGACARRWREAVGVQTPERLGRAVARKTLLAVSGLVSIHDEVWTTDRATAARRWSVVHPGYATDLTTLSSWGDGETRADLPGIQHALDGVVSHVVTAFADLIGLWP